MTEPASISFGIAARYAKAVFELVKEKKSIDKLETDIVEFAAAVEAREDLVSLINSPIYNRYDQTNAILAIVKKMGIIDVLLEVGISELAKKRSEFRNVLKNKGLPGLTSTLKNKADNLLENWYQQH